MGESVRTVNLTKRFGEFTAVNAVSFSVSEGEIFGFLGPNGAGKSTTIRILCGLLVPSEGNAWVDGLSVVEDAESVKRSIGYMSQKFSLYTDLSVRENMSFYGGAYGLGMGVIRTRIDEVSEMLDLGRFLGRLTSDLPTGWRQRASLGCAILHRPKILFLDEPTAGVDPLSRRRFWDLIYHLSYEGTTIFVTTHYMDEAEYCERLAIMHQGSIIATGSPGQLKDSHGRKTIEDVFVGLVGVEDISG